MDYKLLTFNSLIDFFKSERKSADNKIDTEESLPPLIEWIKKERKKFLEENFEELKTNIKKNFKKLRISALSLMQNIWNENTHKNILQYLLDYNSFEQGAEFLRDIIKVSFNQTENELFEN